MKRSSVGTFALQTAAILVLFALPVQAGRFRAFSMSQAEQHLRQPTGDTADAKVAGGITRPVGCVYDGARNDLIVVGQIVEGENPVSLDDIVVALRAVLARNQWPGVSIDATADTPRTQMQTVRFEGGLESTQPGKDLFEADLILKKLTLGLLPTSVWGVSCYFDRRLQQVQADPKALTMKTKFWFYPLNPQRGAREGVFLIRDLRLGVEARLEGFNSADTDLKTVSCSRNEVADQFAAELAANLSDVCTAYPSVAAVRRFLRLLALAQGVQSLPHKPDLAYWLNDYRITPVQTPADIPVLRREGRVRAVGDVESVLEIDGGIQLRVLQSRLLEDGDITAVRDIVLGSRPDGNALSWSVPLGNWHPPDDEEPIAESESQADPISGPSVMPGCSLTEYLHPVGTPSRTAPLSLVPSTPPAMPSFQTFDRLPHQASSPNVGGVMLHGSAKVKGAGSAQVNLGGGSFSLVVDGQNAQLSPEAFRKFVTALWAVYYGDRDPGISIDPIAPGVKKHMVRYIGKVINSDLGRVMREADYLMKQWAVGTGRADIPGLQNPDDIAAQRRVVYVGAMSRFWFVPEDMRFKRAGNLLLFDHGRMTVKTEFMFNNDSMRADPANERFAQFFTDRYTDIAQKYPVYQELFEYAKMVSLAKYLKESGVPLFWFLMANKDLVLTEDSPGTVDALAKGSDYFKGVSIEGGVDLGTQGQYVYDTEAVRAVTEALSRSRPTLATETPLGTPEVSPSIADRFAFDLAGQAYSVLPQHSLTCGKDRRGIRYQTDIAFRDAGFCLTEQALEELDARITRMIMAEEASRSARPAEGAPDEETRRWCQSLYERAVEQARPIQEGLSKLRGQKYSSEQEFAQAIEKALPAREGAGWIKPMVVKQGYYNTLLELVRYFNPSRRGAGDFGEGWHLMIPYRVRPADPAKKEFNGVFVPERMTVQNLVSGESETLTFSADRYRVAGYVPDSVGKSQVVGLFLMSDASFRLADKLGNEFWFDRAGRLTDMAFSEQYRTHFEYADGFTDQLDQPPYRVERASEERVECQGVSLPKIMAVVDSLHGTREALVFDPTGSVVGYVPRNRAKTGFQILAVLSDCSFRLVDKRGNEVAFGPDGKFRGLNPSSDRLAVKSVSVGPYKVDFGYTMGRAGSLMIANARLTKQGTSETLHVVRYEYDAEGRLCKASPGEKRPVAQDASTPRSLLLAKD